MKVLELRISNIRGVKSLSLDFNGDTAVIWGHNGTGKSTIVDALDFLLSGEVGRLTGRRELSLQRHAKHIDAEPSDAHVEATVRIGGIDGPVRLRRCLDDAGTLEVEEEHREAVESVTEIAGRRQHMLTRSEILKFIDAAPRERSAAVESILNLQNIGRVRQALVRAENDARHQYEAKRAAVQQATGALGQHFSIVPYNANAVLQAANAMRGVLGAQPLTELRDPKAGVDPPNFTEAAPPPALSVGEVEAMEASLVDAVVDEAVTIDTQLVEIVQELSAKPDLLLMVQRAGFYSTGLGLVGHEDACPLCDKPWEHADLTQHLQGKIDAAEEAKRKQQRLDSLRLQLIQWVGGQADKIDQVLDRLKGGGVEHDDTHPMVFANELRGIKDALQDPLGKYLDFRTGGLREQLDLDGYKQWLTEMKVHANENEPTVDPRRSAWDKLTQAEVLVATIDEAQIKEQASRVIRDRALGLINSFQAAREAVLGRLYSDVKDRFVDLYRKLHHPDERTFSAELETTDTGVKLAVDFHGREMSSPLAFHSEGHQDSMGICLFLALSERVLGTSLGFRVLDDVVMSVDSGHRQRVADLLAELGGDLQFVVTTHDRVWTSQLRSAGAVKSKGITQLLSWSVDTGPLKQCVGDFWDEIEQHLVAGRVQSAAASLRHGLESFLGFAAEKLAARVKYSIEGRVEFGDLYLASMEQYKFLLKRATKAARSWDQADKVAELEDLENRRKISRQSVNEDTWMVNPTVHFNAWNNLTPDEFRPIVANYKALCEVLECPTCGGIVALIRDGMTESTLACRCNGVSYTLRQNSG